MPRAVYVTGLGVAGPTGPDLASLRQALVEGRACFSKLPQFAAGTRESKPVGYSAWLQADEPSRTHALALNAARQAMQHADVPPDAVVLGVTTGGMPRNEEALISDSGLLKDHATGGVAWTLAQASRCQGPVLTVSTACSSSAVAIKLALEMLRRGLANRVLAGGADGLCRMTHFGFDLLQLVDARGARPLDENRAGMTVSEAGAMLFLEAMDAEAEIPSRALAKLAGAGLSCDAHHATAPHPEGDGALSAMQAALDDAGLRPEQVDYVNLHGTGTPDNDRAEARAFLRMFAEQPPAVSSTKGVTGHPLAAAGALESVIAIDALLRQQAPANAGLINVDPALGLAPLLAPKTMNLTQVMSNSFGFGGNNASLIWGKMDAPHEAFPERKAGLPRLFVRHATALTGVGFEKESLRRMLAGEDCAGCYVGEALLEGMPKRSLRRVKRIGRLAMGLAQHLTSVDDEPGPGQIFVGTAWGAQGETHDFLKRLFDSPERLSSPTDFVGSVHNAPAGMLALRSGARGANVTMTGGDVSFEQALYAAGLLMPDAGEARAWLMGLDEGHEVLSPRLDASVLGREGPLADGGGGMILQPEMEGAKASIELLGLVEGEAWEALFFGLPWSRFGALWLNIPVAERALAEQQLSALADDLPRFETRKCLGEFGSASAVACALAVACLGVDQSPSSAGPVALEGRGVLHLTLGAHVAAVAIEGL